MNSFSGTEATAIQSGAQPAAAQRFVATRLALDADRKLALITLAVSATMFLAAIPFAKQQLASLWAFIPSYQAALVVCDLVTAALLFGQARFSTTVALHVLAAGYAFTALLAICHALSFPDLFASAGVLGGGAQSTAWLYMFWHGGFPLFVIAYGLLERGRPGSVSLGIGTLTGGVAALGALVAALTWLATAGEGVLPAIMQGNRYTPAMIFVVSSVWLLSLATLLVLWRRRPHSVLDLWLMVVMCAWLFDIGLAAVFNGGRFDLGFYAGRIYGLAAASFVLVVLLLENATLHTRLALEHERDQQSLARHAERLRILAAIDQAMIAERPADAIAAAVIQPLRELLDVPRAIVNRFDLASGTVEWVAAAGRHRTHIGPGVRYSIGLMGDVEALRRGETQLIDVHALPSGPEVEALLASGVRWYMAVPMIAGGELIGALSFGGESRAFRAEQVNIAREVATQLAIATMQMRLLERVRAQASGLAERFRLLVEGVRDYAILTLDTEGRVTSWNAGAGLIKGYAAAEILGRHFSLFYPQEAIAQRWPERELELAASQGRFEDEGWRIRKDGSRFWANVVVTAMRDEAGVLRGFSKIACDLSERKRAEEALQTLNRELESFTYSVSHDLRAPLRAIDGYAQMLDEDYADRLDADAQRLIGVVRANARRMGQLIDDLLAFSRLGRQEPACSRVDMMALAREVSEELRGAGDAQIELAALPAAHADAALLRQVWLNLIGNALKYSSKGAQPRIEIGGRDEGAEACYSVRDNGVGFDMRYAEKLFGVFQRLHRADEFEGTGVGLAIVQRIVARHGGRVWAESRPGEGACFHFCLPKGAGHGG
ncbi:MAG TPA: ATP-binding protein [Burkholderiales bacterium]|nr:ATP-binding protein [Burkholderiales bacterium]